MPSTLTTTSTSRTLRIELNQKQLDAYRALRPGTSGCLAWGRGVGKSYFLRASDYLDIAKYDGRRRPGAPYSGIGIVMLMPTLAQARKVHEAALLEELHGDWSFLRGKVDRSTWRISFPGGSWIQWLTAERAKNTRGIRCDKVNVDEADDIGIDIYDGIVDPWLSADWSLDMRLVEGTPTRGRGGLLYRQFRRGKERTEGHWSIHATGYDVPQVSRKVIERARRLGESEGRLDVFKREWLCDFDSAEGLVYPAFHEDFHVQERDPRVEWTSMVVGVDHGFAAPGTFVLIGIQGRGDSARCHVLDEVYKTDWTENEWLDKAMEWRDNYPGAKWYCDPAWPGRIEALRRAGCDAVKANNCVEDGIAEVSKRIAVNETADGVEYARLYVQSHCKNTIKEFRSYRRKRDPKNRDRSLEQVEKRDDHLMDAIRYALLSHFGGPSRGRNNAGWDERQ